VKKTMGHAVGHGGSSIATASSAAARLLTPHPTWPPSAAMASARDAVSVNAVRVTRSGHAPEGAARDFEAEIEGTFEPAGGSSVIGKISGCISWLAWLPELVDEGRLSDSFAELVAAALDTGDLASAGPGSGIQAVLMVDKVWLEPRWRVKPFGRRIAEQLIDLLLLTPERTLVLAHLEPTAAGHFWSCAEHDAATIAGEGREDRIDFERWGTSNTWLLRPGTSLHS